MRRVALNRLIIRTKFRWKDYQVYFACRLLVPVLNLIFKSIAQFDVALTKRRESVTIASSIKSGNQWLFRAYTAGRKASIWKATEVVTAIFSSKSEQIRILRFNDCLRFILSMIFCYRVPQVTIGAMIGSWLQFRQRCMSFNRSPTSIDRQLSKKGLKSHKADFSPCGFPKINVRSE